MLKEFLVKLFRFEVPPLHELNDLVDSADGYSMGRRSERRHFAKQRNYIETEKVKLFD